MFYKCKVTQDMHAMNDPLDQTHSPTSSDLYSHLEVVLFLKILKSEDRPTVRSKIVITTGRDCGSAEWINFKWI